MRNSRRVDRLCLLPRRVSTVGSPEIAKGSVVLFFFLLSHCLFTLYLSSTLLFFFFCLFFSPSPPIFFYFLQVRGNFLSLYYSSCHVSPFPWSICHMDTCSRWHSPHHMALMPCVLLPWCHVATLSHAMWHHPMRHPTPDASKNMKFGPSRNSTKFDWVNRFRETNSMVKSVSSFEIKKISRFSTCTIATNYRLAIFQKN